MTPADPKIRIERLGPRHVEPAKRILKTVWREHFGGEADPFVRDFLERPEGLADVDRAESVYFQAGGTFIVLLDGDMAVGTGAVKRLDKETCELCRMFLLTAYRGKGFGRRVAEHLIDFARSAGYRRIRLGTNKKLLASHRLYRRLGFVEIPPYEPGATDLAYYMEKIL